MTLFDTPPDPHPLWQQADSLNALFELISIPFWAAGFTGTFATTVGIHLQSDETSIKRARKLRIWAVGALAVGVLSSLVAVAIPSSKTIAMMVAIPAIANSEPIQKDIPELYQLAKDALKEQITGKSAK